VEPFLGQIMQVGFAFAPRGWAMCQGQILSISQNSALFSLLGTTFGGNGQTTFGLPNAGGRVFIGTGQSPGTTFYTAGEMSGTENVTLTSAQLPAHAHPATFTPSSGVPTLQAKTGNPLGQETSSPAEGSFLATVADPTGSTPVLYAPAGSTGDPVNLGGLSVPIGGTVTVGIAGSNLPFSVLQPYLAVTTVIALEGIFPSRN